MPENEDRLTLRTSNSQLVSAGPKTTFYSWFDPHHYTKHDLNVIPNQPPHLDDRQGPGPVQSSH